MIANKIITFSLVAILFICIATVSLTNLGESGVFDEEVNLCANITFDVIPDETDCRYFILCQNEQGSQMRCDDGHIFNDTLSACVPGNYLDCDMFTTTTIFTTPTTTPFPTECPPVDEIGNPVFLPDHEDCSKYFVCAEGSTVNRTCADGLFWNPEKRWCDFPENVDCTLHRTTSTTVLTTTTPVFRCSDWLNCPISGFGYLPHLTNCVRYFWCDKGIRNLRTCTQGQIFDVLTLRCGDPATSMCARYTECN